MSSIKSLLCVVVLATAMAAVACGSDSGGGSEGDAASQPRSEAGDGSSKNGGEDQNKENGKERKGTDGNNGRDDQSAGKVIRVSVAGDRVEGVGDTVDIALGEEVTILVRSDTPDEVHVHGYDVIDGVGPGEQAEIELTADIPGAFEVELEDAHLLLFELRVQ